MLLLGFACAIALMLVGAGIYILLNRATGVDFNVQFRSAKGLNPGNKVLLNGIEVGQVHAVKLTGEGVEVAAHLEPEFVSQVRGDARVAVKGKGLNPFGEPTLEIIPPTSDTPAPPIRSGAMLEGLDSDIERGAWQIGQMLSEGSKMLSRELEALGHSVEEISQQFQDLGNSPELKKLQGDVQQFVNKLEQSGDKVQRESTKKDWPQLRSRLEAEARELEARGKQAGAEKLRQLREKMDQTMQKVDQTPPTFPQREP